MRNLVRFFSLIVIAFLGIGCGGSGAFVEVPARSTPEDDWETYRAKTVELLDDYEIQPEPEYSRFGGLKERRVEATGFFHAREFDGRWWLVDPDGYLFIHTAVVATEPGGSERQERALERKYGSEEVWAEETTELFRGNGFNGAGCWSAVDLLREVERPLVYTVYINPMSDYNSDRRREFGPYENAGWQGFENDLIYVFEPEFERYVEEEAQKLAKYRDDPFLLGYFTDNELPFVNDALDRHMTLLPDDDPGYRAARKWFTERKGADATAEDITDADREAFNGFYAGTYFEMLHDAIRRYDPNHMYLGSRFNQEHEELQSPAIFEAAGKYMDAIAVNIYRVWEPGQERLENWASWSGRPILVTEWYTKGADTGMPNRSGAGWIVPTQRDRGLFYQNFVLELLKSRVAVGWHWFRYQDNDPADLTTDPSNRDSNKGIVDSEYDVYEALLEEMRTLNTQVYPLIDHFDGAAEE